MAMERRAVYPPGHPTVMGERWDFEDVFLGSNSCHATGVGELWERLKAGVINQVYLEKQEGQQLHERGTPRLARAIEVGGAGERAQAGEEEGRSVAIGRKRRKRRDGNSSKPCRARGQNAPVTAGSRKESRRRRRREEWVGEPYH